MMERTGCVGARVVVLLLISAIFTQGVLAQTSATSAVAELKDAQGQAVGNATFTALESGAVRIQVQLQGFSSAAAGEHGLHIHAVGVCEGPEFTSAGGHFNPTGQQHGLQNPAGPHAGDLPNIPIGADGRATYEATNDRITLSAGPNALLDADGSALVVHAGPDDHMTDPAGDSGARIACGVITAAAGLPDTGTSEQTVSLWLTLAAVALTAGSIVVSAKRRHV